MTFLKENYEMNSFVHDEKIEKIVNGIIETVQFKQPNQYVLHHTTNGIIVVSLDNEIIRRKIVEKYANEIICQYTSVVSKTPFGETGKLLNVTKIDFVEQPIATLETYHQLIQQTEEKETIQWRMETIGKHQRIHFVRKNVEARELQTTLVSLVDLCHMKNIHMTECFIGIHNIHQITNHLVGTITLSTEQMNGLTLYQFMNEFIALPMSYQYDCLHTKLIQTQVFTPLEVSLLRGLTILAEQFLCNINVDLFTLCNIQEALVFHVPITKLLLELFTLKFNPYYDTEYPNDNAFHYPTTMFTITEERKQKYEEQLKKVQDVIRGIDTGRVKNDTRRKIVLEFLSIIITNIYKTNYYAVDKVSLGFRLHSGFITFLDTVQTTYSCDYSQTKRLQKFPELPFGIFFIYHSQFFGFQVRFRDLARGGLRTVINRDTEMYNYQRIKIFEECYNLAYTQQKKNKDIPEGGSKGIIFLQPNGITIDREIIEEKMTLKGTSDLFNGNEFEQTMRNAYLYQNQKRFLVTFLSLINFVLTEKSYELTEKYILDYLHQPEYIYLGPDENMHDYMIEWLSKESIKVHYFCGGAFISGKEETGINHKEYGVTSIGCFEFMKIGLDYLHLDKYTIKITGGPNGDVAGNLIHLIKAHHYDRATITSLCSSICVVLDNEGVDIDELDTLFLQNKALQHFDVTKLHTNGFMLRLDCKQSNANGIEQYKIWRKTNDTITEEWIESTQAMKLYETTVHQNVVDVFAPCGGRPFSLNENNIDTFFNNSIPSCKLIVEGANLYFTPKAREILENNGVIIFKDSSANKCGVVSSSYEILGGLGLDDDQFIAIKKEYASGIITRLKTIAQQEGSCMIDAYTKKFSPSMVKISEEISKRINEITDDINAYLLDKDLFDKQYERYMNIFMNYIPHALLPYKEQLLKRIPQMHMKAIIATSLATKVVYSKGLSWKVSIIDIIDTIL